MRAFGGCRQDNLAAFTRAAGNRRARAVVQRRAPRGCVVWQGDYAPPAMLRERNIVSGNIFNTRLQQRQ